MRACAACTLLAPFCDGVDEGVDESELLADDVDEVEEQPLDRFAPGRSKRDPQAAAPGADAPEGPEDLQAVLPEGSAAQVMYHYTWNQGWGDTPMRPHADHFCFLTRVSGNFDGAGEMVRIYQNGSYWYLGGTSQQAGVSANATCIPRNYWGTMLYPSIEYSWTQYSPNPTYAGNGPNRICFLTRVTGKFMGAGERVQTYRVGNDWYIGGSSGQNSVGGGARCVDAPAAYPIVGPLDWSQGQGSVGLGSANDWACGLTRVQGKFAGAAESVTSFISNDWWYLGGSSAQSGIAGSAACL